MGPCPTSSAGVPQQRISSLNIKKSTRFIYFSIPITSSHHWKEEEPIVPVIHSHETELFTVNCTKIKNNEMIPFMPPFASDAYAILLCRCGSCSSCCRTFSTGTEVHCTGSCHRDQGEAKVIIMYEFIFSFQYSAFFM